MTETEERSEKWKLEDPTLDLATTTSSVFGKMPLFPMSALLTVSSPWYLPQLLLRNISDFFFFGSILILFDIFDEEMASG